jgi:hypothetical protein
VLVKSLAVPALIYTGVRERVDDPIPLQGRLKERSEIGRQLLVDNHARLPNERRVDISRFDFAASFGFVTHITRFDSQII